MNGNHRLAGVLLAMAAAGGITAQVQAQEPVSSVVVAGQRNASPWFRAESQHFVVYSNTNNEAVYQLLNQLEKLDYVLRIYTQPYLKGTDTPSKLTFYYHDDERGLNAVDAGQPANTIAMYSSCEAGVQGAGAHLSSLPALTNDKLINDPLNEGLSYLFEAYARHFLYRYTDIRAPGFFIDGFAQFFASARFSDNQMALGRTPDNMRNYLNFIEQGKRYSLYYRDVLDENLANAHNYAKEAGVKLEFAARSWLLTHYMLHDEERRKHLPEFLNAVHRDTPAAQAFEQVYGVKVDDLGTTMWRYRLQSIKIIQVDMPALPVAHVSYESLPQSSGLFVQAAAVLKSCPSPKVGAQTLREVAAEAPRYPSNDLAQLTLARAQIGWGNPADALPYLDAAVQRKGAGAETWYLRGLAHLRQAERGEGAERSGQLTLSRKSLAQALALEPASAEAAYAYYRSGLLLKDGPDENALDSAVTAWYNAREVDTLARSAALAYAYAGNLPKARATARVLAQNRRAPELASWGKEWEARFAAGVGKPELLAEMRRDTAAPQPFHEWTIAFSDVMHDVEYNAGLEAAQGYLDSQTVGVNPTKMEQSLSSSPVRR